MPLDDSLGHFLSGFLRDVLSDVGREFPGFAGGAVVGGRQIGLHLEGAAFELRVHSGIDLRVFLQRVLGLLAKADVVGAGEFFVSFGRGLRFGEGLSLIGERVLLGVAARLSFQDILDSRDFASFVVRNVLLNEQQVQDAHSMHRLRKCRKQARRDEQRCPQRRLHIFERKRAQFCIRPLEQGRNPQTIGDLIERWAIVQQRRHRRRQIHRADRVIDRCRSDGPNDQ